jgi:hypothetical protein
MTPFLCHPIQWPNLSPLVKAGCLTTLLRMENSLAQVEWVFAGVMLLRGARDSLRMLKVRG